MVKRIFKIILCLILVVILLLAAFLGYLTYTEFNPESEEELNIFGAASGSTPRVGYAFNIMTWNIGYGALGDNADFFMDGGTNVKTSTEERVNSNIANITSQIKYQHPDIVLLQEVDRDSDRSYRMNEAERIMSNMSEMTYTFAKNYDAKFVPYPWPPIGKVESGLLTMSGYEISEATRTQLPVPFAWPIRLANLKRCLAIHRIPVEGLSDGVNRELVVINLHLEAYDDGAGRAAQTELLSTIMENEYAKGNYVIAGGDFNQSFSGTDTSMYPELPGSWECQEIDESAFSGGWQFIMDTDVPTCRYLNKPYVDSDHDPSTFQYYMLDGFIVSPNIKVVSFGTKDIGFQYSDHNPVIIRVKLLK